MFSRLERNPRKISDASSDAHRGRAVCGLLIFALLALGAAGCGESGAREVGTVKVLRGADQCALPGEDFSETLRFEVTAPDDGGFPGGREEPVAGALLRIYPIDDSDLRVSPSETATDVVGCAEVTVSAGKIVGDHYLKVEPVSRPDSAVLVRLTVGVRIDGDGQEGAAGGVSVRPITVTLVDGDGKPAADVPVFFRMVSTPSRDSGGEVLEPNATTGADGTASAHFRFGDDTGEYRISVEAVDPDSGVAIRPVEVSAMGIDVANVVIVVAAGVTFLIFGMMRMSSGLQKIAGESMKKLLRIFSGSTLVSILAGALVTAAVQSSSATTVMVLGFINAGLLNLQQSIGIIFGANVGTTITAQLISFDLDAVALPAVTAGFVLYLCRDRVLKGWGEAVFGFGMLFFGMTMMSQELRVLGEFPSFAAFFANIDCAPRHAGGFMPVGAVLGAMGLGIAATCVVQSSAAVIGIILALAGSGVVNFYTAVPMLIGTNIGTTATAWLAAAAGSRESKEAAMAHTLFNFFGALLMIVLFYVPWGERRTPVFLAFIDAITPGNAFAPIPQNLGRHIAMAHTFFNVAAVAVMIPFVKPFAGLCARLVPGGRDRGARVLEPLLLRTPALAIAQAADEIRIMAGKAWEMVDIAVRERFAEADYDPESVEKLTVMEDEVDAMQTAITDYLVEITRRPLTPNQAAIIPVLMHCTNDAERIADHTEIILKLTKRLARGNGRLSETARHDLKRFWSFVAREAAMVERAFEGGPLPGFIDDDEPWRRLKHIARKYEATHSERRDAGECEVDANVIFIEMLWEIERIGGHVINIAQRLPRIRNYQLSKHADGKVRRKDRSQ